MACSLEMYNSEHKGQYCPPAMSPRISFSNDFVEAHQLIKQERSSREVPAAPASTDFEFSVTNNSMMSADELFFKGRLLPFKDTSNNNNAVQRTIRDELQVGDDGEENEVSRRPPKGSTRWKGLLGLKRSHLNSSKKFDRGEGSMEGVGQGTRRSGFLREEVHVSKRSQELFNDEGVSSNSYGDEEIGI